LKEDISKIGDKIGDEVKSIFGKASIFGKKVISFLI